MKTKLLLSLAGLASVLVLGAGVAPTASATHFCPGVVIACSHSQVGTAGVCASLVGCVAWCATGGFDSCGATDCYRFTTLLDVVQVCANALP